MPSPRIDTARGNPPRESPSGIDTKRNKKETCPKIPKTQLNMYFQVSAVVIPITPKWTDKPKTGDKYNR